MRFSLSLISTGLALWAQTVSSLTLSRRSSQDLSFDYSNSKVRGVNLGGWLVLEPYITPSLFEPFRTNSYNDDGIPVDEYHYTQALGKEEALARLQTHWQTFYTEQDFIDMAAYGLNHVRIPIGYWAFQLLDNDPYVQGQEAYMEKALEWARAAGLKAWIDLHGVPGSQNGFDNSGLRDTLEWSYTQSSLDMSIGIIKYLAEKYGGDNYSDVVTGIELVNEPLGPALDMDVVKNYFTEGFWTVRGTGSNTGVIIHDAFQPMHYWDGFMDMPTYWHVILDHHHYQVFSDGELARSIEEHIGNACELGWATQSENLWRVVGEWSAALTDCAPWLNGVGNGARWDGTFAKGTSLSNNCWPHNDVTAWSEEFRYNYRRYIEAQLDSYDQGAGWIFWCYKTENALEWDFVKLTENKLFPQPLDERWFPNQCRYY
ncbi:exo-1,3-beta glucanase [Nadsonia fulvescens var. elongata DSM 6958]|uniref:glucan 1,3-beta-glucosidase n=1 Tax=Nadsonia fulvescens var. elongata DSM 6958 TaxID=857566 RepID=A0A1E3PGA3_9ASCO|nr:exo-1,3-beta glucanase [Nadsonia fulvescens var. elongata DSM 6958]